MSNIIAIESKSLSKGYDKRYVIADKETGEILDERTGLRVPHAAESVRSIRI